MHALISRKRRALAREELAEKGVSQKRFDEGLHPNRTSIAFSVPGEALEAAAMGPTSEPFMYPSLIAKSQRYRFRARSGLRLSVSNSTLTAS